MAYSFGGSNVYYYGDPDLENITDLRSYYKRPQSYPTLLREHSGSIFQDPEFPHTENSIGDIDNLLDTADPEMASTVDGWRHKGWNGRTSWIRITELCQRIYKGKYSPCFNAGDIGKISGRLDIQQGLTGDCWFLCSLSAVSMVSSLMRFVIPEDNNLNNQGIYHFRFWYQGAWVDIVVDDFIPVFVVGNDYNILGSNFFVNNKSAEFWPMLVEKAFAKLNGNYCKITANVPMYALEALSGGFGECVIFKDGVPPTLFEDIVTWLGKDSVNSATANTCRNGIIGNHAYSVTGAKKVKTTDRGVAQLLRLRNPWGNTEWTGDWCDDSPLWKCVSQREKEDLGLIVKDDGEFWICFDDFTQHFSDFSSATYFDLEAVQQPESQLRFTQVYDEWKRKRTAGGWAHPDQCPHHVVEVASNAGGYCVLIASVTMQHPLLTDLESNEAFCIRLFEAKKETKFDAEFFRSHKEIFPIDQTAAPASVMKSFTLGFTVKPGRYVIVPNIIEPGVEKKFCLRILSQKKST